MPIGREVKLLISSIVLIALAVVLAIQYTDVCRLEAVTLNGQPVQQWDQKLGLIPNRTVIRQPVDSLANALLEQQGITRVDIQYRLPNMLKISTNSLDPICYLIDRVTGTFFGLDESGRVVPIDIAQAKWDMPIFTGLRVRRMHDYTDDYRANLVIPQLMELRRTNPSLYQTIEDVDFSRPNYVGLGFAGKSFRLRVPADHLLQRFDEFNTFVSRYSPPMDSTSCFDMTYDDEIIRIGAVPPKPLPPIDTASVNDKADFSDEAGLMPPGTVDVPVNAAVSEQPAVPADEVASEATKSAKSNQTVAAETEVTTHKPATTETVHKQTPVSKPVTKAAADVAPKGTSPVKTNAATTVAKKTTVPKSKVAASPDAKGTKPAAVKTAKLAIKSQSVVTKTAKTAGQSKIKGTAIKKAPAKKTKTKTSPRH